MKRKRLISLALFTGLILGLWHWDILYWLINGKPDYGTSTRQRGTSDG
jgi:hypothetical protein